MFAVMSTLQRVTSRFPASSCNLFNLMLSPSLGYLGASKTAPQRYQVNRDFFFRGCPLRLLRMRLYFFACLPSIFLILVAAQQCKISRPASCCVGFVEWGYVLNNTPSLEALEQSLCRNACHIPQPCQRSLLHLRCAQAYRYSNRCNDEPAVIPLPLSPLCFDLWEAYNNDCSALISSGELESLDSNVSDPSAPASPLFVPLANGTFCMPFSFMTYPPMSGLVCPGHSMEIGIDWVPSIRLRWMY